MRLQELINSGQAINITIGLADLQIFVNELITSTKIEINTAVPATNPRIKINGIRGLAAYLEVSIPTAQRLKNSKKFPFYESGNKVFMYSDEVDAGLKVAAKVSSKKPLK